MLVVSFELFHVMRFFSLDVLHLLVYRKPILEEWTGMELEPSSMYGIRMYTEGGECVDSCINFLFPNLFLT